MAVDHYENFPVASLLLPARLRPAVRDLYAFARGADDIADEGDAPARARLERLEAWRAAVRDLGAGRPIQAALSADDRTIFARLGDTLVRHRLPIQPLLDLLSAFIQDLWRFAAETPFELKGLQSNVRLLTALGFSVNEVIPILRIAGDAARVAVDAFKSLPPGVQNALITLLAANKLTGIRAGLAHDAYTARQMVEHDDANVLCLGSRVIGPALAEDLVKTFIEARFTREERHVRRLEKIRALEQ